MIFIAIKSVNKYKLTETVIIKQTRNDNDKMAALE